jgi:hypothetical protein
MLRRERRLPRKKIHTRSLIVQNSAMRSEETTNYEVRRVHEAGGVSSMSGAIYFDQGANNIHVEGCTIQNFKSTNAFWLWNTQNTYIQKNTIKNGYQGITWRTNKNTPALSQLVLSDNTITGMSRMGIETGFLGAVSNMHMDRNTLSGIATTAISWIGNVGSGSTCYGNVINNAPVAIEYGNGFKAPFKVWLAGNQINGGKWGFSISHCPGSVTEQNVFTKNANPFSPDGGYDKTEWIGVNTINGKQVTGWSGHTYGPRPALLATGGESDTNTTQQDSQQLDSEQQLRLPLLRGTGGDLSQRGNQLTPQQQTSLQQQRLPSWRTIPPSAVSHSDFSATLPLSSASDLLQRPIRLGQVGVSDMRQAWPHDLTFGNNNWNRASEARATRLEFDREKVRCDTNCDQFCRNDPNQNFPCLDACKAIKAVRCISV